MSSSARGQGIRNRGSLINNHEASRLTPHASSFEPNASARILELYTALGSHYGHEPHWWPIISDTPVFEILVGAVLVQQTRWETVEAAIGRLLGAGLLSPQAMASADTASLAQLIRPCAFHNQKAPGLQVICRYLLERYDGDIPAMLGQSRPELRAELLALPRFGRETADTVMLYAGGHPIFIVDAYARRLFARLGLLPELDVLRAPYDTIQAFVEQAILGDTSADLRPHVANLAPAPTLGMERSAANLFFWELHALINEECIHHCLASNPRCDTVGARRRFVDPRKCAEHCRSCDGCPLRPICPAYQQGLV